MLLHEKSCINFPQVSGPTQSSLRVTVAEKGQKIKIVEKIVFSEINVGVVDFTNEMQTQKLSL